MALSMLEMKVVLATVLGGCEFESNLMEPVKAVRRGITFVPPDRFRLTVVGTTGPNLKSLETDRLN